MRLKTLFVLFIGKAALGAALCPPSLPDDVCKLEARIFLQTDFHSTPEVRAAMVGLKDLLVAHDADAAPVREHILGLVDKVIEEAHTVRAPWDILAEATGQEAVFPMDRALRRYEKEHGDVVPLDWELPPEIRHLVFMTAKSYDPAEDRTEFHFGLFGGVDTTGLVEQIQITRFPGDVIADKLKLGGFHEAEMPQSKVILFSLGGTVSGAPLKEGLYLLDLKVKGRPVTKGWFILSRATPTALPVVQSPALSEMLKTEQPTLRWLDFRSPQFRPLEHRKRRLSVYRDDTGERIWNWAAIYPERLTKLTLPVKLRNGAYTLSLAYEERWLAGGGIFVGRESGIHVPFTVARP